MNSTNFGTIIQNCIVGGRINLDFDMSVAEQLAQKLPPGKPIHALTVGKEREQVVANQYLAFLQSRGFKIERHDTTIVVIPEPDHPISIFDNGDHINLEIAASIRY